MQDNKLLLGPWEPVDQDNIFFINEYGVVRRFDNRVSKPTRNNGSFRYCLYYDAQLIMNLNINKKMRKIFNKKFKMDEKLFQKIRQLAEKHKLGEKRLIKYCAWCGAEFSTNQSHAKYCSYQCNLKYNNWSKRARAEISVIPEDDEPEPEPVVHDVYIEPIQGQAWDAEQTCPGLVQPAL